MERNAHYALVGLVSLVLVAALMVFVVWLARLQVANGYDLYDVDFAGPVRGLSAGGEVYFNGIKVGQVTKLTLNRNDPNRVVARIRIADDAPVRTDSTGTLEPLGITGINYIQITAGTTSKPLLKEVTPANRVPVIQTTRGQLESLLEGGGTVLSRAVDALDWVNKLLSDKNINSFSTTMANIEAVSTEIKNQKQLLADLDQTVKSANETAKRFTAVADNANGLLNGDGKRAVKNLADAADELKGTATEARKLVAGLEGPTAEFATTGLPQLTRAVVTLQQAAESLDRLVGEVERNPSAVISKPPAKTVEVKP